MNVVKNTVKGLLIIMILANTSLLAETARGWHWYNEPRTLRKANQKKQQKKQKKQKKQRKGAFISAVEVMKSLREVASEAKAKAVLYPTEENVRDYLIIQNFVVRKARIFSKVWKKVLLHHPELDYSVLNPTENNAQRIIYKEQNIREQRAIDALRKKYGLFYFYRGQNPLDQELSPSISAFARANKIALMPVTVDGTKLSLFEDSKIDHGEAATLGIKYFPALILVNPKNHKIKPINYGFIAGDELRRRFLQVATNFNEGA